MEVLYETCCGLDVHKSSITACVLHGQGHKPQKHLQRFGCTTRDLLELVGWLKSFGVHHVVMESTGVYWKPVGNVLEELAVASKRSSRVRISSCPARRATRWERVGERC